MVGAAAAHHTGAGADDEEAEGADDEEAQGARCISYFCHGYSFFVFVFVDSITLFLC